MTPQNYQCTITAPISASEAFDKIGRVGDWWAVNFKGNANRLGDRFTVHFARTTWSLMEVVDITPNEHILWKVVDCCLPIFKDPLIWKGHLIAWEIGPQGPLTQVTMTHIGLFPGIECYEDCRKGWNFYVGQSLLKLFTEEKGLPGSGIFADIVVAGRKYEGLLYSRTEPFPDFAEGWLILDVRENRGEQVVAAYSVNRLSLKTMSPDKLMGDYYMILDDTPAEAEAIGAIVKD